MIKNWRLCWKDGTPVRARFAPHRQWFLTQHSPLKESRWHFGWRLWRADPPVFPWTFLILGSTLVGLVASDDAAGIVILGLYASVWILSIGGGLLGFWLFTVPPARRRQWKYWNEEHVMPFPYGWMRINGNQAADRYWIYAERRATTEEIDGQTFVPHSITHRATNDKNEEIWLVAPMLVEGMITEEQ